MGSGKTYLGKMLAQQLDYVFVDMDALIEKKYHKAVSQIFAEMGEDKFREIERECLHEVADFEKPSFRPVVERPAFSITWII